MFACLLTAFASFGAASTRTDSEVATSSATPSAEDPEEEEETDDQGGEAKEPRKVKYHVGGAIRFNAFYKSWDETNKDKSGDFAFDTFRFNADVEYKWLDMSLEYRFYSGYSMLHHGYVEYTSANGVRAQVGVSRKPFGLLPYASHNWFFDITYYLGMEDDYDAGVKVILPPLGNWDLQFAFYKASEGSYTGDSIDSARYSYDVVRSDQTELGSVGVLEPRTNEETNQFNARGAYTFHHSSKARTEIGISGEYGQLYNGTTTELGYHRAVAVHYNATYGRTNVMFEVLDFAFRPENPVGQDDRFIVMGAYDAPYKVAAEGSILVANVAYTLPLSGSPVDSLMFYNNYSYLRKREDGFADSQQNVLGMLMTVDRLLVYFDAAFGKNHPWIGSNYGLALAEGVPNADWELRFNINIGYYF